MTLSVSDNFKYANLQMAAEAFLKRAGVIAAGAVLEAALMRGNGRNSKFTELEAEKFSSEWVVEDQEENTGTGFSGTLFRNITTGELVISFRSTEFLDDAARDNQATNAMEIATFGFAFGQLRDMEDWYGRLISSGKIPPGATFSVTGYSLGGHLATAFNMLHKNETVIEGGLAVSRIKNVVTFNGAGIGGIDPSTNLQSILANFKDLSQDGFAFSDTEIAEIYQRAKSSSTSNQRPSSVDMTRLRSLSNPDPSGPPVSAQVQEDAYLLLQALGRIQSIRDELERLSTLRSGDSRSDPPAPVPKRPFQFLHHPESLPSLEPRRGHKPLRAMTCQRGACQY